MYNAEQFTRLHEVLASQAADLPDHPAVADTLGNEWTYSELQTAAVSLSQQLQSAGVQPGDRVLLLLENCAPAIAALFACSVTGATVVPINARLTGTELNRVIDHSTPAAILSTAEVSPDAKIHAQALGSRTITGEFGSLELTIRDSTPDHALFDVGVILYTTGTTGTPKGVMLTHSNAIFGGSVSAGIREITQDDLVYGVLPISHVFGLTSVTIACVLEGATIRLAPRFNSDILYNELNNGITVLAAVPQMLAKLMHYTESQGHNNIPHSSLRFVSAGASPLDVSWKRRAEKFFGIPIQNGYGMTETSAGICVTTHKESNDDTSVGRPLPGVQVKIDTSATGNESDTGEILVRGGNVMKGYFRNKEATTTVLSTDGWLRTGDLGLFDTDGNLHIKGRSKELIIHGGFNIYPPEVEAALNEHPLVIQSAVIGEQLDGDEHVVAFVEIDIDKAPAKEDLLQFAAKSLAPYKRPSRIVLTEKLPATVTGKVLKHLLLTHVKPI